jgi:hypothetical protein
MSNAKFAHEEKVFLMVPMVSLSLAHHSHISKPSSHPLPYFQRQMNYKLPLDEGFNQHIFDGGAARG